jgi:hypothetical protein
MTEPDMTPRRTIASFEHHADAEALVDRLAQEEDFPVDRLSIIGEDLELIEDVASRTDWSKALLGGAGFGAVLGAVFGMLFGVWFPGVAFLAELLYWAAFGAVLGGLMAAVSYALGGAKHYTANVQIRARRYDVTVDERFADEALHRIDTVKVATPRAS